MNKVYATVGTPILFLAASAVSDDLPAPQLCDPKIDFLPIRKDLHEWEQDYCMDLLRCMSEGDQDADDQCYDAFKLWNPADRNVLSNNCSFCRKELVC